MSVLNYLAKSNVVVDSLSHLSMGSVSHIEDDTKQSVGDVHRLALLGFRLVGSF